MLNFRELFFINLCFILDLNTLKDKDEEAQELIKNLQVFEVVCSKMHSCFVPQVIINTSDGLNLNS